MILEEGSSNEFIAQGKSSLFFPLHKNSVNDVEFNYKKFKCLDEEYIRIQGDYNSGMTRSFVIQFEKCDQEKYDGVCKSDEEIEKWMRRKFILSYSNQKSFWGPFKQ